MKLTLRQAHKLVEKITAKIATLDVTPTRNVNVYDATVYTFDHLTNVLNTNLGRLESLIRSRCFVRELIGLANQSRVDGLIAKRKLLLDLVGVKRALVGGVTPHAVSSPGALAAKIETLTAGTAAGGRSSYDDTVSVCLISEKEVNDLRAEIDLLQLQVESVEDELTAANADPSCVVVLPDHVRDALAAEGIIAK